MVNHCNVKNNQCLRLAIQCLYSGGSFTGSLIKISLVVLWKGCWQTDVGISAASTPGVWVTVFQLSSSQMKNWDRKEVFIFIYNTYAHLSEQLNIAWVDSGLIGLTFLWLLACRRKSNKASEKELFLNW